MDIDPIKLGLVITELRKIKSNSRKLNQRYFSLLYLSVSLGFRKKSPSNLHNTTKLRKNVLIRHCDEWFLNFCRSQHSSFICWCSISVAQYMFYANYIFKNAHSLSKQKCSTLMYTLKRLFVVGNCQRLQKKSCKQRKKRHYEMHSHLSVMQCK